METKTLFEKVLKDNEIIKGQLNNLQTSIQTLKNNMIESQNNKNNINFSSLLDDLNISSSKEEIDKNENQNIINNQSEILFNINQESKEKKIIKDHVKNKFNIDKKPNPYSNKKVKESFDNNIYKRNIKKTLKEKEVINQIYLLKENFNNYNNYNIYNKSCIESTSKKNSVYLQGISRSNKKNKNKTQFNYNNQNNSSTKKTLFIQEKEINNNNFRKLKNKISNNMTYNSANKGKRTNSMINMNLKSNNKNKNKNKKNLNKFNNLRYSYDDYYNKNENFIENKKNNNYGVNKRVEILNYLMQINNLQNIISQLKKENSLLKISLEKEKQKNNKFRKITEEIINYFENPNNGI